MKKLAVLGILMSLATVAFARPIDKKTAKQYLISAGAIKAYYSNIDLTIKQGVKLQKSVDKLADIWTQAGTYQDDEVLIDNLESCLFDIDAKTRPYNKAVGYKQFELFNLPTAGYITRRDPTFAHKITIRKLLIDN